jgi:hypothetical protein
VSDGDQGSGIRDQGSGRHNVAVCITKNGEHEEHEEHEEDYVEKILRDFVPSW